MKFFVIIVLLTSSLSSFAGSLDCHFTKDSKKGLKKESIVETTKTGDPEEESETYKGTVDSVKADVIYLPYQEGIYLYLEDSKREVTASSINNSSAVVSLETKDGTYSLSCSEKK